MTVVLSIHGLGANWLGCYGNEWIATPNLDRLAAEGVVYDNHYAEKPGDFPWIRAAIGDGPRLANVRPLLEKAGDVFWIEVAALLPPWFAPAEIFEDYYDGEDGTPIAEPHDGDEWEQVHASFAAAVTMVDAEVGALVDAWPEATWIVTSDGGFPLGEHDIVGREGNAMHEELAHLPLIVRHADRRRAGTRVSDFTVPGDLALIARGEMPAARTHVVSSNAIRTAEWTMIRFGDEVKLFHRPEDRFEVNDISRVHPDVVEELSAIC